MINENICQNFVITFINFSGPFETLVENLITHTKWVIMISKVNLHLLLTTLTKTCLQMDAADGKTT